MRSSQGMWEFRHQHFNTPTIYYQSFRPHYTTNSVLYPLLLCLHYKYPFKLGDMSQHTNAQPATMSWKPSSNHQVSFHYFPNQPILISHYYTICNSFPMFCTLQILMFKSTAKCLENKFTAISNKN